MNEYKGIYYNESTETQKFYEGGAHFKYSSLYNILETLHIKQNTRQNSQPSRNIQQPQPQYQQAYNHTLTQIQLDKQKQITFTNMKTRNNNVNASHKEKESQTIMNYNCKKTNKQKLSLSTNQKQTTTIASGNVNQPQSYGIPLGNITNQYQSKRNNHNIHNSIFNGKANSISKNKGEDKKKSTTHKDSVNKNQMNSNSNININRIKQFNLNVVGGHSVTLRKKVNGISNNNNNHFSASVTTKNRRIVSSVPKTKNSLCKSLDEEKLNSPTSIRKNKKSRNANANTSAIGFKSINLSKSHKKTISTQSLYTMNNKTMTQNNVNNNKPNNINAGSNNNSNTIKKKKYEIINSTHYNNNISINPSILRNHNNYTQLYLKRKLNKDKDDSTNLGMFSNSNNNNIVTTQRKTNHKQINHMYNHKRVLSKGKN